MAAVSVPPRKKMLSKQRYVVSAQGNHMSDSEIAILEFVFIENDTQWVDKSANH